MNDPTGALTAEQLANFHAKVRDNAPLRLMQNVVTQHDVNEVALNRNVVTDAAHNFFQRPG